MKKDVQSAIVAAADKDFTNFKASIESVLQDKLQNAITTKAEEFRKNIFAKGE